MPKTNKCRTHHVPVKRLRTWLDKAQCELSPGVLLRWRAPRYAHINNANQAPNQPGANIFVRPGPSVAVRFSIPPRCLSRSKRQSSDLFLGTMHIPYCYQTYRPSFRFSRLPGMNNDVGADRVMELNSTMEITKHNYTYGVGVQHASIGEATFS